MGWIRVSDDFYDNDKLGEVGPLGVALHFAAMGFCNRNLTDGFFKKGKARLFLDFDGIGVFTASVAGGLCGAGVDGDDAVKLVIEWMVAADLWHEKGHDCDECHARADGGEPTSREYLIHDYLKFQPSRAEIEAKAEANRKRVEAFRAARKAGNASSNGVSNGVGNALRTDVVTPHVQHTPNPTPNPSTSPLVTSGGEGYVSNARDEPSPHCPKHPGGTDRPCRACADARRSHEDWTAQQQQNELADRRRQREIRENCPRCKGTNWVLDTDPAVKCDHEEARQA